MAKCFNPDTKTYFSPWPPVDFPAGKNHSITAFLFNSTASLRHETALIDSVSGETLIFLDLETLVSKLSHALSKTPGVKKNDVVLIFAPNSIHFPVCFLAAAAIGAVTTTCNPEYTMYELEKQIKDSNPKITITTAELFSEKIEKFDLPSIILLSKSKPESKTSGKVWDLSDLVRTGDQSPPPPSEDKVSCDDVAMVLYSSGTTGMSKGVDLTHGSIIAAAAAFTSDQDRFRDPRNMFLCFLPMFHAFGLILIAYAQLQRGNSVVSMERFELGALLRAVERHHVTHLYLVPPVAIALAKYGRVVRRFDLSSLVEIFCGAAPLGRDVIGGVSQNLPSARIIQGYGTTETAGIISMESGREGSGSSGSCGHLVPSITSRIIHVETSKPLPPNQLGEICVKGPNVMKGYYNNYDATRSTIDKQGWLHTGDLGYFNNQGELFVVDRIKELIKCYGFQVAPGELEAVLLSHPQILDAVVIPFPDEKAGEVPIAQIVRSSDSSLTENDVKRYVENRVAPFKRLREVTFVSSVPKTASGKILRRKVVQKLTSSRCETPLLRNNKFISPRITSFVKFMVKVLSK